MSEKSNTTGDLQLIDRFVESWAKLDDLWTFPDLDPVAVKLSCAETPASGGFAWCPRRCRTDRSALSALYAWLPAPLPPLYEQLILGYRWAEVDLRRVRLLANPPGPDLSRLGDEIRKDKGLAAPLLSNGFVQFGRSSGPNYDPVCFDTRKKRPDGECRIVRLDHEAILQFSHTQEVEEVAPTFRSLVRGIIEDAHRTPSQITPPFA